MAIIKISSSWPLLNKYALSKTVKWVSRPHRYFRRNLQTPLSRPKWLILVKMVIFVIFGRCGYIHPSNFTLNGFGVPFSLIGIHFDLSAKIKFWFTIFCLPIGYIGPLRYRWRSTSKIFRGHICLRGVKWNAFWPRQIWKLKPSLFQARLNT